MSDDAEYRRLLDELDACYLLSEIESQWGDSPTPSHPVQGEPTNEA